MHTNYKETKEEVLNLYVDLLRFANKCGIVKDNTSLKALAAQAKKIKEGKFCLLIAGEAKSGKSTFINAYLGTEILPMDVRQCTSSVVEIAYGDKFYLEATYADGRTEKKTGKDEIHAFLAENAAIEDRYREIPVTTINNEIIVKYKDRKILETEILDLLEGVKKENIHNLPEEEYNTKIRNYIKEKQQCWQNLVIKIDIFYPFEDENMKGIRIIDSPGVNAAGRVGDVTAQYIESADAIMFVRPISGVAIESESFKEFLESKSVDRNKNAIFLVLTRIANEPEETIATAYEECVNIFGTMKIDSRHGIIKDQIIPVDSKAELYFNRFKNMSTPEIRDSFKLLKESGKADPFLKVAWYDAECDKNQFLDELKRISRFDRVDQILNTFGRKAQYIALSEFLERILKMYTKMTCDLKDRIEKYSLKLEDPTKLAVKISEIKEELRDIENNLNQTIDEIELKYAASGNNGLIQKEANSVMNDFRREVERLDESANGSIDMLEKAAYRKVDAFINFQDQLQQDVVAECNEALKIALGENQNIDYTTLEPDFTPELIESIKEEVKKESYESYTYTTGTTFKKSHRGSRFSQKRYFHLFKDSLLERIELIKQQAVRDLRSFVNHTLTMYTRELAANADAKRIELEQIKKDKRNAEDTLKLIAELRDVLKSMEPSMERVAELKGGIDIYV